MPTTTPPETIPTTPANAVALAIADHKALNKFPDLEFTSALYKAGHVLRHYPEMVAALQRATANLSALATSELNIDLASNRTPVRLMIRAAIWETVEAARETLDQAKQFQP